MANSSPSLEKMMGLGAAGLLTGLIVGAVVFHGPSAPMRAAEHQAEASPVPTVNNANDDGQAVGHKSGVESFGVGAALGATPAQDPGESLSAHPDGEPTAGDSVTGVPGELPEGVDDPTTPAEALENKAGTAESPENDTPLENATAGLSESLRQAVEADRWFRKTRLAIHSRLGTGALAQRGGLTGAGRRIVERAKMLDAHGLGELGYNLKSLEQRVVAVEAGELSQNEAAELEAHLGKVLLRLVMDYRLLKVAGPFKLRSEADIGKEVKHQTTARKLAVAAARAESAEALSAVLDPPHPNYEPMLAAHIRYQKIVEAGGCKRIAVRRVKPGDKGDRVKVLQERLACEGVYDGPIDSVHNDSLTEAVKLFQRTHEIDEDGIVMAETAKSMNVPMERRAEQLKLGLQRLRESRVRELGNYYLTVNIPSFHVKAVEDGKVIKKHRVIVGTNRLDDDKIALVQGHLNRTKLFTSKLYSVIVNPSWILPSRIAKGELEGKMEEDPNYLKSKNIRKKTLGNGTEVLIQGRGKGNVLGKVKFLLEKTNAIYLHDTDKPWLFKKKIRAFSHGCMRLHEAVTFAQWLMLKDGWDDKEVHRRLSLQRVEGALRLKKPVDFLTEYVTVDIDEAGNPEFLTDVYGYDRAFAKGRLPPRTKTRWGSIRLRPRWVPKVPNDIVKKWRASGKAAPRDPKWRPPPS